MKSLIHQLDKPRFRKKGITIYEGSPASRHLSEQVIRLLLTCIAQGFDLSIRSIQTIRKSFDEGRCVYALDTSSRLIGFTYLETIENPSKKSCAERCSLITLSEFRISNLGKNLIDSIFDLAEEKYPQHDFLSRSSNPIIWNFNIKKNFKEISYKKLLEDYGIDITQEEETRPHVSYWLKKSDSKNSLDKIKIINEITGYPEKCMVLVRN